MNINKQHITAVILAGGRGSRLGGQDKGLVKFDNKPLIEHILERIKPQVDAIIINANRNLKAYENYGNPVINDLLTGYQGPLAGFISAMAIAKTSHILTLPCDGPMLPLDLVDRMLKTHETLAKSDKTIIVAHDGARPQNVHALIPLALIGDLKNFVANGNRKVEGWYATQEIAYADFSDCPTLFSNINTERQREEMEGSNRRNHR